MYRIQVCSDVDYDKLIAEIYIDGKFLAIVHKEREDGVLEVQFPGCETDNATLTRAVELEVLTKALMEAKLELSRK